MDFFPLNYITTFFNWILKWLYINITHDYVLAIVIIVLFIKFLTLPLDLRQRRMSAQMAALAPKMDSIKKRYPDPQVQQQKISELYKKENVKPLAGCLPMLIQFPILIAFYACLRALANIQMADIVVTAHTNGTVDLPSFFWVHNMWQPDSGAGIMPTLQEWTKTLEGLKDTFVTTSGMTKAQLALLPYESIAASITAKFPGMVNGFFVLPIVQVGLMFLQQKLTASQQQGAQPGGKMFLYIMALFSGYICLISPAVFAIYWILSNIYMIIQTLILNKFVFNKEKTAVSKS